MNNKKKYEALIAELEIIEVYNGLYLADENVDHENVQEGGLDLPTGDDDALSDAYYREMIRSAVSAAGYRAGKTGQCINTLIGRVIF